MGLVTKMNCEASWMTVVRRGVVTSILGTSLYFSILWWNDWWSDMPFKLGICATLLLFVGGLFEWQIPEDDCDFPNLKIRRQTPSKQTIHWTLRRIVDNGYPPGDLYR